MVTKQHRAYGLRCEHRVDPMGIDQPLPRLSWKMRDDRQGARQQAYQIVAASSRNHLRQPDLWDSGKVESSESLDIAYAGKRLQSRQDVFWRVRIANAEGKWSTWSRSARLSIGLLNKRDWIAEWITSTPFTEGAQRPCPYLRREFQLRGGVIAARLYTTARGCYECHINGQRVGADLFAPGWTDYNRRLTYAVHDVTSLLQEGGNAWGAILADGWFAGNLGFRDQKFVYGQQLSFLGQLEIQYADGSLQTITTDQNWRGSTGPVLMSDHYHGENYDARLELPGWSETEYADAGWSSVEIEPAPSASLVAQRTEPVRLQEVLKPIARTQPAPGTFIFDLGQNMVGSIRLKLNARRGTRVQLRYGEMLQQDGALYTANLRSAKATDIYVCRGRGSETIEPRFTFHGFRYVEVKGLSNPPECDDLEGLVWHSDMQESGSFRCSDARVNQLQQNIRWGQKGNFFEAPTDCPQRDERLGWLGDAQVFIRTACFNYDVSAFFTKWCIDMEDSQDAEGMFPHVCPNVLGPHEGGAAAWADAGVICPWTIYLCCGDKDILARHYGSMKAWIRWQQKRSHKLINKTWTFGDWLAIDIAEDHPGLAPTPTDLIGTAYFAHTTMIVSRVAAILGKDKESKTFSTLAERIRKAFCSEFLTPNGRLAGDTQTGYLVALAFDLLPDNRTQAAFNRLVELIESRGTQLTTGFVGTPLINPVLTRFGRNDLAYKLLLRREYPSWLYTVDQGATTMWERWNSYTSRDGFGNVNMNSFNHYAYGAIGEWLYASVAGIDLDPDQPGYRHVIFHPQPGAGLRSASAALESRYGRITSKWKLSAGGKFELQVSLPPNTTGTVILANGKKKQISSGRYSFQTSI